MGENVVMDDQQWRSDKPFATPADTYLSFDRSNSGSTTVRKTASKERLNDQYMERIRSFEESVENRCKKSNDRGYLCPKDRVAISKMFSGLSNYQFETPSGYFNAKKIKESKLYGAKPYKDGIRWGECDSTRDPSIQLRGCVRGDANRTLVSSLGNNCQTTSSAYPNLQQLEGSIQNGGNPIGCADSVGHAQNYSKLDQKSVRDYGKFLKDTISAIEQEEVDVLNA